MKWECRRCGKSHSRSWVQDFDDALNVSNEEVFCSEYCLHNRVKQRGEW